MSPKKTAAGAAVVPSSPIPSTTAGGEDKFSWTVKNERSLAILCMGRTDMCPKDYRDFVKELPGSTYNGIRFRIAKLRKEQVDAYTKHNWPLPETNGAGAKVGGSEPKTPKKSAATKIPAAVAKGKKRTASETNMASDADIDTNSASASAVTDGDANPNVNAGTTSDKKPKTVKKPHASVKRDTNTTVTTATSNGGLATATSPVTPPSGVISSEATIDADDEKTPNKAKAKAKHKTAAKKQGQAQGRVRGKKVADVVEHEEVEKEQEEGIVRELLPSVEGGEEIAA